jgi:hypothetical protein
MNALEFTVKIENGVIHLPKEYHQYNGAIVRVIILIDEPKNNVKEIMTFAGAFSDMSEEDYNDYLAYIKRNRNN